MGALTSYETQPSWFGKTEVTSYGARCPSVWNRKGETKASHRIAEGILGIAALHPAGRLRPCELVKSSFDSFEKGLSPFLKNLF